MTENKQNRFKSWALWVAAAGYVWTIMSVLGIPQRIGLEEGVAKTLFDSIGGLLVLFGILNNPTDKENF